MRRKLTEMLNPQLPMSAMLEGMPVDFRRIDTPVQVLSKVAHEVGYYRVQTPDGRITIANDSMLYTVIS